MLVSKLATSALARSALKKVVNPARHFSSLQVPGLNLGHEEDYVVFPKEREGLEYALNWSLADDGLTAAGEAFGNIKMASLKKRLGLKSAATVLEASVASGNAKFQEAGTSVSFEEFDSKKASISEYLSSGIDLYVEDGAAGSFRGSTVGVRIVTDDPVFALVAKNLLNPVPKKMQAKSQPITVLLATKAVDSLQAVAFDESAAGALVGATVVLAGTGDLSCLAGAVAHAAAVVLGEAEGLLPLPTAAGVVKGAASGVLVGAPAALLAELHGAGHLYAAHGVVVGEGLASLLNGAVLPAAAATAAGPPACPCPRRTGWPRPVPTSSTARPACSETA